jgi:methylisocitrate lyase
MIFAEALTTLEEYRQFTRAIDAPVLATSRNSAARRSSRQGGARKAGVRLSLYPLSAFRAMAAAADNVYRSIREDGTQKAAVDGMQTRADLYEVLDYHAYEQKLDELFTEASGRHGRAGKE